ncbi:MAG: T9SS type A sorting domain-containing protein [Fibrobacteres bacterium]|nr:T9SS type A sorting domain-containing protein [Fibrobacterota bacterium]
MSQWSIDAVTGTWKIGPGNNYILNPSFEADRVQVAHAVGWEGTAANSDSPHGAGNFCLGLASGAKATQRIPENPTIAGIPAGTYEMKSWVRSSGGTCQISISGFGGSDMSKSSNAGSWTEISIPNIKISTGKAIVSASNTGSGTCSMDDFSLVNSNPVGVNENPGRMDRGISFDPATYRFQPTGWNGEAIRLEMYTVGGKMVLKQSVMGFDAGQYNLPVGRFESGNYLLKVSTDKNSSVQKITIGR